MYAKIQKNKSYVLLFGSYLSVFGCYPNVFMLIRWLSSVANSQWPQVQATAQSQMTLIFPFLLLLDWLCILLDKETRRKLPRKTSRRRSFHTLSARPNPTTLTFSLLFLQSTTLVTNFKLQIVGVTPVRCRFHLWCKSFLLTVWSVCDWPFAQVREMRAMSRTSQNTRTWWKRCWRSGQQKQLLFSLTWRMLTALQKRYGYMLFISTVTNALFTTVYYRRMHLETWRMKAIMTCNLMWVPFYANEFWVLCYCSIRMDLRKSIPNWRVSVAY